MAGEIQRKEARDLSSIFNSNLFFDLQPGEKKAILDRAGIVRFRKGGRLFSPGEKANHLYCLLSGHVRVFKVQDAGREDEIAHFNPGDLIGDFDFARDAAYDAYAEAAVDSTILIFPGAGFSMEKFALEEPQLNSKLLLNSAAMVTGRIKATRRLIIESAYWVKELHRKIYEDPSTGLWKQSFLTEEINQLLEKPTALILLKPDRFKILVDANGHDVGDEAMILIAAILKGITRKLDRGWALRFKSNETGILLNKCDAMLAKSIAISIYKSLSTLPEIPLKGGKGKFPFSGSIAWGIWPDDDKTWDSLFEGTYKLLMDTWKAGGNRIAHYRKAEKS